MAVQLLWAHCVRTEPTHFQSPVVHWLPAGAAAVVAAAALVEVVVVAALLDVVAAFDEVAAGLTEVAAAFVEVVAGLDAAAWLAGEDELGLTMRLAPPAPPLTADLVAAADETTPEAALDDETAALVEDVAACLVDVTAGLGLAAPPPLPAPTLPGA